jgi:predicted DNA-binding ribbon-helix-helix protein
MRLETEFWDALKEVADREKSDIGEICTRIARDTQHANLSSAVRVAMMNYYREMAFGRDHGRALAAVSVGDD